MTAAFVLTLVMILVLLILNRVQQKEIADIKRQADAAWLASVQFGAIFVKHLEEAERNRGV